MDKVELKVKSVIAEQLGKSIEQLENSKSFVADLGADSLDTVSLLIALEEELSVEISDEAAGKITTVQAAIDFSRSVLDPSNNQVKYEHNKQV